MKLAKRIQKLSPSVTLAVTQLAKELKTQGRDILSFSAGEPDFDTPKLIKDTAIKAINDGKTKYTEVAGIPELKSAIVQKLKDDHGLEYCPEDIIVSNGAKHSLFNIFQTIVDEGDEVIIPAPYWVTYPEQVKLCGGKPVFINTTEETNFCISAKDLKNVLSKKTVALVLNSPSNPTGSVYSDKNLLEIAKVLEGTDVLVLSDEMYEKIIYDGKIFTSTAQVSEDMFQRTITINGLSKSVAMTGWRFGYLASVKKDLIKAMTKLQGQCTSNINTPTQYAAIPALKGKVKNEIEAMRKEFEIRRNKAFAMLNAIDGLSCFKPDGAFYLFVSIKDLNIPSVDFCSQILEKKGIALVPGLGFGLEGYFRFSFATDLASIEKGIKRIEQFIKEDLS